jgi:hypothetical protein
MNRRLYLARETGVSAVVNGLISVGFFAGTFGRIDPIPVWGTGNYAFDFVPQSFAVAFMSVLVPGFLARKAIGAGKFGDCVAPHPRTIAVRSLSTALVALLMGAGAMALLLRCTGWHEVPSGPAFAFKIVYGALLGAFITLRTVARMTR